MGFSVKKVAAIGQVAQAIANIGIPAVREIVTLFESNAKPTMAELDSIGSTMAKPEDFFKNQKISSKRTNSI